MPIMYPFLVNSNLLKEQEEYNTWLPAPFKDSAT